MTPEQIEAKCKLLPCPFCAGKVNWCDCDKCDRIWCKACRSMTEFSPPNDCDTLAKQQAFVSELWNARAAPASIRPVAWVSTDDVTQDADVESSFPAFSHRQSPGQVPLFSSVQASTLSVEAAVRLGIEAAVAAALDEAKQVIAERIDSNHSADGANAGLEDAIDQIAYIDQAALIQKAGE